MVEFGAGFFDKLCCVHPDVEKRLGIEIWQPYIDKAASCAKGVIKIKGDIRNFEALIDEEDMDCAMLVDVLEHLEMSEAIDLVHRIKDKFNKIILMIPEGNHPQAEDAHKMGADEYQTHRSTWYKKDLIDLGFQEVVVIEEYHKLWNIPLGKDIGCLFAEWKRTPYR